MKRRTLGKCETILKKKYPEDKYHFAGEFEISHVIYIGDEVFASIDVKESVWPTSGEYREIARGSLSAEACRHLSKKFLDLAEEIEYWKNADRASAS